MFNQPQNLKEQYRETITRYLDLTINKVLSPSNDPFFPLLYFC